MFKKLVMSKQDRLIEGQRWEDFQGTERRAPQIVERRGSCLISLLQTKQSLFVLRPAISK
jgi:hypothetical protein